MREEKERARGAGERPRGAVHIGTSGWQYDSWRGRLYPAGLKPARFFEVYAQHFACVEVNNTFYRLPRAEVFEAWRDQAPPHFHFALKYSRFGSHMKKLADPEGHVSLFMSRAERLGGLLGPILVQLPPGFKVNPGRLDAFLEVARHHHPLWAVEFREPDWLCDEIFEVLRRHGAALCVHDMLRDHPREVTAGFAYLRFHGGPTGNYSPRALAREAEGILDWLATGIEVWAFFNNDAEGRAVENAASLSLRVAEGGGAGAGTLPPPP